MIKLDRLDFETPRIEKKLNPVYSDMHQKVITQYGKGRIFHELSRFRWMSASLWLGEQAVKPDATSDMLPAADTVGRELHAEFRASMSDYGNLSLKGLRLFLILLTLWLILQEKLPVRLDLWSFSGLILGCMIIYPITLYTLWNWGSIHSFKVLKLVLAAISAFAAWTGVYLLSVLEKDNPLFEGIMLTPFNFTEFLILFNLVVILSFIIYYRQLNLLSEINAAPKWHLVSLSGFGIDVQMQVNAIMNRLDNIPLKALTRRRLKGRILEEYSRSGTVDEDWIKDFIRLNCIDMNWMYWSGSIAQWSIVILLLSKLIWARDTGLMVSADYFRQELTTGMVLGAIILSTAVFCPINRCFRELLYQGVLFSMKQAWLLMGSGILCVSVISLSGLVPSRFVWGIPINPAPHPWGFTVLLGLVFLLQFFKSDPRFQSMEDEQK